MQSPCGRVQAQRMAVELEEVRLKEKQLKHKLEVQAESLREKGEELRVLTDRAHETMTTEVMELQVEKAELESLKVGGSRSHQSWVAG